MSGTKGGKELRRIGDVARELDLKTCVLRFWEEEFPQLRPHRTEKGQRLYSAKDVKLLHRIRSLLHEQGMTIDGARRVLAGQMALPVESPPVPEQGLIYTSPPTTPDTRQALLQEAAAELAAVRDMLLQCSSGSSASSLFSPKQQASEGRES